MCNGNVVTTPYGLEIYAQRARGEVAEIFLSAVIIPVTDYVTSDVLLCSERHGKVDGYCSEGEVKMGSAGNIEEGL